MDDLEQLQKTFDELQESLITLNQEIAVELAGIKNGHDPVIDVERWHDRKQKILVQLPVIQSKLLAAEIKKLTGERDEAKTQLDALEVPLQEAAKDYDEQLKLLQKSYERHAALQVKAFTLQSVVDATREDRLEKKAQLRELIESVTGFAEVAADSPPPPSLIVRKTEDGREFSYTDNLLNQELRKE